MPLTTIKESAEQILLVQLDALRGKTNSGSVLHCGFSAMGIAPAPAEVAELLKPMLADRKATVFCCWDGDVLVWWVGRAAETAKQIRHLICKKFPGARDDDAFFRYHDFSLNAEELRDLCREKITAREAAARATPAEDEEAREKLRAQQLAKFAVSKLNRAGRAKPEILIVEDIEPSRKLLKAVIGNVYICHAAADAAEAVSLYAQHAPDIAFLDIQLPDGSGHDLARLLNEIDPDSYLIMATANSFEKDVKAARENKVKGYVTKPITLEKIQKCLDGYFAARHDG